jgi:TRAP-type C4-dicarboxylate transport system permease small subunit
MSLEKTKEHKLRMNKKFRLAVNLITKFEDGLVILFLFSILSIAILQIILRNVFDSGLIWGDSLLSILVLWLGLSGSIVASRQKKHINIDVFSSYLPETTRLYVKKAGSIFTALVCLCISYYSFIFIYGEYELNEYAFSQIPVWVTESIIPFAFCVMAIRYFIDAFISDSGSNA